MDSYKDLRDHIKNSSSFYQMILEAFLLTAKIVASLASIFGYRHNPLHLLPAISLSVHPFLLSRSHCLPTALSDTDPATAAAAASAAAGMNITWPNSWLPFQEK